MTYLWISENQIAGSSDSAVPESEWPSGFTLVAAEADPATVYWDGSALVPIPEAPSAEHVWDGASREWVLPWRPGM
jgi:hypothetical protein